MSLIPKDSSALNSDLALTIMLVDDDPTNLRILTHWLKNLAQQVVACASADEALSLFDEIKPDILISDIQMQGKSGLELTKAIKEKHPSFPIILMTAFGNQQDLLSALNMGTDYFLLKPVDKKALERYVEKLGQTLKTKHDLQTAQAEIVEKNAVLEQLRTSEMHIGAGIQQLILYRPPPSHLFDLRCAHALVPAQMVNGDFLDHFVLSPHCYDFVIGDAMGKGLAAGLLAAGVKTGLMRALTEASTTMSSSHVFPSVERIIAGLDAETFAALKQLESFVTLLYVRIDTEQGIMKWVDCGHSKIILQRQHQKKCILLSGDHVPLGILSGQQFKERSFHLLQGDRIYLLTDGLSEVNDAQGVQLGIDGVVSLIQSHQSPTIDTVITESVEAVRQLAEQSNQLNDDKTMLGIEVIQLAQSTPYQTSSFDAEIAALPAMRDWLQYVTQLHMSHPLDEAWVTAFILGASECFANILRHGLDDRSDKVEMNVLHLPNALQLEIYYHGKLFMHRHNPAFTPELLSEGSYGLFLIDTLFDAVEYYADNSQNQAIVLRKNLSSTH